jgi:hypothetical protein
MPKKSTQFLLIALLLAAASTASAQNYISITSAPYNAVPNDNGDDTPAIVAALAAAKAQGKAVYIPVGRFLHTRFTIDGVTVYGEGEASILHANDPDQKKIEVKGNGASVRNLKSSTVANVRTNGYHFKMQDATNFIIDHVWVIGGNGAGIFIDGGSNGIVTNNYVEGTMADAIHNTKGAHHIVVVGNIIRNSGDDCVAVVSYTRQPVMCSDILVEKNDSRLSHARAYTVVGGQNVTIRNNKLDDTESAGIYISSESAYNTYGVNNVLVENNRVDSAASRITSHAGLFTSSSNGFTVENVFYKNNTVTNDRGTRNGAWVSATGTANMFAYGNTYNGSALTITNCTNNNPSPAVTGCGNFKLTDLPLYRYTGLKAEYFNNITLSGSVVVTRSDATVNNEYGQGSPAPGIINTNNFSARWTGQVEAPVTGAYTFTTTSDDGVRLWVNGNQVINNWTDHGRVVNNSSAINLTAGQKYDIRMEYYDKAGGAVALLQWSHPGQSLQIIPANRLLSPVGSTGLGATTSGPLLQKAAPTEILAAPNPVNANELLTLQVLSEYRAAATLTIVALNGRVALNRTLVLQEGQNTIRIPMNMFGTGVYMLNIYDGKKQIVKKIFVGD